MAQFFIEHGSLWEKHEVPPSRVCSSQDNLGILLDTDDGTVLDSGSILAVSDSYDRLAAYWREAGLPEMMDHIEIISVPVNEKTVERLNKFLSGKLDLSKLKLDLAEFIHDVRTVPEPTIN